MFERLFDHADHISTHAAPCGERRFHAAFQRLIVLISTHAPRAGERQKMIEEMEQLNKFQPTLPVRGAT